MLLIIYSAECIKHVIHITSFGYKIRQGLMESGKERIPMASEDALVIASELIQKTIPPRIDFAGCIMILKLTSTI